MSELELVLTPNRVISKQVLQIIVAGQIIFFLLYWTFLTPTIIPKPIEILSSLRDLWGEGLVVDLMTSLLLYAEALVLASIISLALAYASTIAFFKPLAEFWSKLRFLGLVGIPFLLTLYLKGGHELKLALLTFSISVFMVTSMLDVVDFIPKEKYDLARTLRFGEWQVLWEVVILGRADVVFDVIRQNAAIGWMMLPMIEGMFRSEGGLGALLDIQQKLFHLSELFAIQISVLLIGLGQDYLIGVIKQIVCPYANLLLERR